MTSFEETGLFNYELPAELIASRPSPTRSASRLLVLSPDGAPADHRFADLPSLLRAGDLLVVNDARVLPVRLHARRATGGLVEVLVLGMGEEGRWDIAEAPLVCLHKSSKALREGEPLEVEGVEARLTFLGRGADGRSAFRCDVDPLWLVEAAGSLPLPPYIVRERQVRGEQAQMPEDAERYQTVFARAPGSVAAPTAGLHFDEAVLAGLERAGVRRASLTLHVGTGTFRPVGPAGLAAHRMHEERYGIPEALVEEVRSARSRGGRVVAVGTTVVRALESAAAAAVGDVLVSGEGRTDLMIAPGYRFRVVEGLVTNFHLPRSTLLALVAAFGGTARVEAAYRHAVANRYRFYSYGDAMFVLPAASGGAE